MVINKSLDGGKIKMALEDRLTIALAKLKRNNLILTENQLNMLRRLYELDGVHNFISKFYAIDMAPIARAIMFLWLFVNDEYELFKSCVNKARQPLHDLFFWFKINTHEQPFIITYISLCHSPELDQLGLANAEIVTQFLHEIGNQTPSLEETMRHEDKYVDMLESMFARIKATTEQKISPDILAALQVLKSDLQPTEDKPDRRAENLFVSICYFLNKVGLNVPQGHAKTFLRGNLSLIASQIMSKQIIDNIDHKVVDRFHSRVIDMFDKCLKGVPPPTYKIKDPLMPVSPGIFVSCIDELIERTKYHQEALDLQDLLDHHAEENLEQIPPLN
jgi:hypothetical protein